MRAVENVIIRPIITEKSTILRAGSTYVFEVLKGATKIDIRRAVEKLFKVKVLDVNTARIKGKSRGQGKAAGITRSWKKAYVKLGQGQKIDLIELEVKENLFNSIWIVCAIARKWI